MKKRNLGRFLGLFLVLAMMTSLAPTVFAADFSDVAASAWYKEAVDYVSDHGLMAGTGGGRFDPDSTMSRAMLVTVLYRMDGTPSVSGSGGFSDVPAGQYYTSAVAWAAENGIVAGVGGGRFDPNALISREQFATILYRYAGCKGYDTSAEDGLTAFADAAQVGSYAVSALRWAVGAGIITGSEGRLMPAGSATRAQAAAMLMRFVQSNEEQTQEPEAPTPDTQPTQGRVLVAYFSRANYVSPGTDAVSGATSSSVNTKTVAEHIQAAVGGDLFEIVPERDYPTSHSECSQIAGQELEDDVRPELTTHVENMEDYDVIVLGYPAWHHTAPMAVRTFLEEYDFSGKTIVPYMTSLGNSVDQSVADIRRLCPDATVLDGIAFSGSSTRWNERAEEWVKGLDVFTQAPAPSGEQTPITLTIGSTVLEAYLNDSAPAQSLLSQLPLTVTLNDSDNDFCGGNLDIEYTRQDVQSGYKNGDLAFWTPANNFVIFVDDEESSANTGDLVILGHITSPQSMLDALEGQIRVTIQRAGAETAPQPSEPPETDTPQGTQRMKITVGDTVLYATLEDNDTARAIAEMLPMTLSMMDLYGREMCYRFANALPANEARTRGYDVGEIVYWPPRHSFVILYEQNGERFEMQSIGRLESGVDAFGHGDVEVTFELAD